MLRFSALVAAVAAVPLPGSAPVPAVAATPDFTAADLANASEPDDCICCERTLTAMTRYCKSEMPMGDLKMDNFDCAKEMGTEITFNSESVHQRWSAIKSCKCDCDKRLAELRSIDCPMACKRLPFACPICTPPPPPPPPPAPPKTSDCKPVSGPCCEGMLNQLEKFCYSFEPKGEAVKIPDATHWDGGIWQPPASFDGLCEAYTPEACGSCGTMACPKALQLIARQFHPNICDAVKMCMNFCDNQCPPTNSSATLYAIDPPVPLAMSHLPGSAQMSKEVVACEGPDCARDFSVQQQQAQQQYAQSQPMN